MTLGSRLSIRQVGYNWKDFSKSFKVVIDIDIEELKKPTLKIDLPIHGDLNDFLPKFVDVVKSKTINRKKNG